MLVLPRESFWPVRSVKKLCSEFPPNPFVPRQPFVPIVERGKRENEAEERSTLRSFSPPQRINHPPIPPSPVYFPGKCKFRVTDIDSIRAIYRSGDVEGKWMYVCGKIEDTPWNIFSTNFSISFPRVLRLLGDEQLKLHTIRRTTTEYFVLFCAQVFELMLRKGFQGN